MALLSLLFVLVQSLIQYPQPAGDGLDEATHRRMQEPQELLDHEMARLLQELEQGPPEQQDQGWGAVLFGALQQWPFWALAGVLLLLGLYDVIVEKDNSSSGHDIEGSSVAANEGEGDDVIEGNSDVKVMEDIDVKSDNGHDFKKDEGWNDGNVPGDNTEGNEDRNGNVAENTEGLDEGNEGVNKDVQVEQDKDAGKEEEGDGSVLGTGSEEKSHGVDMKASNSDVNAGEDNVDGKEEYTDVKEQESSNASEQRSSDWTGQEDSSNHGNEVDHSGVAASEEENKEVTKEDDSNRNKDGVKVEGNKNENR
ncbi:hypothetical protein TURU_107567 [Turdus rufiventris]|nr:hypothetical protein TURU_107567 [Turdus rufiventris]